MARENHVSLLYKVKFKQRPLYPGRKRNKIGYFAHNFSIFDYRLISLGLEEDVLM